MKNSGSQALFERYQFMSDDALKEIINSNEYDDEAKQVAQRILNSDRVAYYQSQQEKEQAIQNQEKKNEARKTDPLYEDIHQIAGDLRFIKNFIIVSVIAALAMTVISLLLSR